jgi:hypothetical protein
VADSNVIRVKPGVQFGVFTLAGLRLLTAVANVAADLAHDFTITSGTDGTHSGPDDPHHSGNAYDVRSQDVSDKQAVLLAVMKELGSPTPDSGGYVTDKFFGWLEQAGTANEHFHFQLRHGQVYP